MADTPSSVPVQIHSDLSVQFPRFVSATLATGESDEPQGDDPPGVEDPDEPTYENTRLGSQAWRVVNNRTRYEYEVTMGEATVRAIHDCNVQQELNLGGGSPDLKAADPVFQTMIPTALRSVAAVGQAASFAHQGWSYGVDTRIRRQPTTLWPWRTVVNQSKGATDADSDCTHTLIGPWHAVSAAHCVMKEGSGVYGTPVLSPGRDGIATLPYSQTIAAFPPPAGEETLVWVPPVWATNATPVRQ